MQVSTLIILALLAASSAAAQDERGNSPVPPSEPVLFPRPAEASPAEDDAVGRIEGRLERIERRLDAQNDPAIRIEPQVVQNPIVAEADGTRYRYQDGVWWYLLPSNRWVYWSNGAWMDYFPASTSPTFVYRSAPVYSSYYVPSYGYGSYYSTYGGYYPYSGGYRGNWGSAIGLGLSIGHGLSHHGGHHFGHHGGHHGGGHHGGGHHGGHGHH